MQVLCIGNQTAKIAKKLHGDSITLRWVILCIKPPTSILVFEKTSIGIRNSHSFGISLGQEIQHQ
jgi:hypothetical protein